MALELPEIKNIAAQMTSTTLGKTIKEIVLGDRCASLIKQNMCNLDTRRTEIIGTKINTITPKGKWIFLEFANGPILALGEAIGKFLFHEGEHDLPQKYHVLWKFNDGSSLSFQSSLYAMIEVLDKEELANHRYAGSIGLEPVAEEFTFDFFAAMLEKNRKKALKALLVSQNEMSGIGNSYVNDILFESRLHPKRKSGELTGQERNQLYESVLNITQTAIEKKGCANEVDLFNQKGGFVKKMDKASKDKPCPTCETKIVKASILGSSAYICPNCQRL